MKQPCKKDCDGRSSDCHATCPKWKEWEKWKFEDYDKQHFKKDIEGFLGKMEKDRMRDISLGKLNSRKNFKRFKNNY